MHRIKQGIWQSLGSTPLLLKWMGMVVACLLFILLASILLPQKSIVILLATAFLGAGCSYVTGLYLIQPIQQVIVAHRKFKDGGIADRLPVTTKDELGQVQAAYNELLDELQRSQEELKAINELAEALTFSQGIDAVIEIVLHHVINLTEADVGAIYLQEKDNGGLKLKASQGILSPELITAFSFTSTMDGSIPFLRETCHTLAIEDVRVSKEIPAELATLLLKEGFMTWVCAPLKVEGEVIGVYHLGKREKHKFNTRDLALLEVIGNVVGSSLSNTLLLKDLRHKETELRRALHRAVELQEEERKRLARELHDEVGQALTSILIRLKALQDEKDQGEISDRLDDLRQITAQTIEELRRLAMDLRPVTLDSLGIIPALRWYTHQCAEHTGLEIEFYGPEECERLSPETELILYRVVQEGITNSIRHGKAKKIEVILERKERNLQLVIKDNGRGFSMVAIDRGLGLVGIRERIELLNGKFTIHTAHGAGTQLKIEIPLRRNSHD